MPLGSALLRWKVRVARAVSGSTSDGGRIIVSSIMQLAQGIIAVAYGSGWCVVTLAVHTSIW